MKQMLAMLAFVLAFGVVSAYADSGDKTNSDVILYAGFENGKIGDWKGRGSSVLSITDGEAYKGKYSLLVTKRSESWNGPEINLSDKMFKDGTYKVSVWAKIKDGQPESEMKLTGQREASGKQDWDEIFKGLAKPGKWMNLSGEYTPTMDFDRISIYVEAAKPNVEFYIDEASITVVKQPPVMKKVEDTSKKESKAKIVKAKKGTPIIDGIEDDAWKDAEEVKIDVFALGTKGSTGTAKLLWDETNLYVFIKVTDGNLQKANGNPWEQDSVEIFVDEKNNKSGDYAADDAQYRVNFQNEKSYGGSPSKFNTAVAVSKDGYYIEAAILFKVKKGAPGNMIGFDLQINDDPGTGKRESITKWNDPTNDSYKNTSNFGVAELVE